MNFDYQHLVPADFNNNSRVWVYQANRKFLVEEALQLEPMLHEFTTNWVAHEQPVKAYGNLFFGQFIVLMADEQASHKVSGCSTDKSVHWIKEVEQKFKIDLLDRQNIAFVIKDAIQLLPFSQIAYAAEHNYIEPNTLFFNNLVQTKYDFLHNWIIPIGSSWLNKKTNFFAHKNQL